MIVKKGSKYVLMTKDGSRVLGTHDSEETLRLRRLQSRSPSALSNKYIV